MSLIFDPDGDKRESGGGVRGHWSQQAMLTKPELMLSKTVCPSVPSVPR